MAGGLSNPEYTWAGWKINALFHVCVLRKLVILVQLRRKSFWTNVQVLQAL